MQFRSLSALVMCAAVAACSSVESPVAVDVLSPQFDATARGVKPPPPLGTEETDMVLSVSTRGEEVAFARAESPSPFVNFSEQVRGRYLVNTQSTNAWVDFVSTYDGDGNVIVLASPNARLQYNEKSEKTTGQGTLTDAYGNVVYLNLIQFNSGSYFRPCFGVEVGEGGCANASFTYDGENGQGTFSIYPVFNNQ